MPHVRLFKHVPYLVYSSLVILSLPTHDELSQFASYSYGLQLLWYLMLSHPPLHISLCSRCSLRPSRGDFMVSPRGCGGATFYVVVMDFPGYPTEGIDEWVVGVPLKTSLMASCKTNNYLLNALTAMESEVNTPSASRICVFLSVFACLISRPCLVINRFSLTYEQSHDHCWGSLRPLV